MKGERMADTRLVIYSTPTCPYCKRAKEYLSREGIPYSEHNVAADRDAAREMVKKSGQLGVPVITIDDKVIVGFNQTQLGRLLSPPRRALEPEALNSGPGNNNRGLA
jgi:glutaredoxin 3